MTEQELHQLRREKWRLNGKPVRTIEEARAFVDSVGLCLMYPQRPAVPLPTFIGATIGAEDQLPTWQHAYSDPRTTDATEMMVRMLRERAAFEANSFDENNGLLIAASAFPYFYALVGERNPKLAPTAGSRLADSNASPSSSAIRGVHALSRSRRSRVTSCTSPRRSLRICSYSTDTPRSWKSPR